MTNVVHFPLPDHNLSDEHLDSLITGAESILRREHDQLELERDVFQAAWRSAVRRLEAMQVRRLRLILAGVAMGAASAWIVDGRVAQILDRFLTFLGWVG